MTRSIRTRRIWLWAFLLTPACGTNLCQPEEPPTFSEITYLHFKQPNRDASYPKFSSLIASDDGTYFEDDAPGLPHPYEYRWGMSVRVLLRSSYNRVTQYSSSSVEKVIWEKEVLEGPVRLHGISSAYFKEDKRTFIDSKAIQCKESAVCDELDKAIEGGEKFDLVFEFGSTVSAPLEVVSIEPPTCYWVQDCHAREECCRVDGKDICVEQLTCPEGQIVDDGKLKEP